jgi:uncharacterized membrane protein
MTPAEYRTRCRMAESCLPPAEYRTLLTQLHDDMLGEIEVAHAVGIRQEQTLMDNEALLRQALKALEEKNRPLRRSAVDFEAIAADQAMTIELDKVLMQQALEALKELQYAATTDKAFAMADAAIDALKERLK